jgi:hypothetical protein
VARAQDARRQTKEQKLNLPSVHSAQFPVSSKHTIRHTMKNTIHIILLILCTSVSVFAQATFDYMLFRPGVQYLYDSPVDPASVDSPILGMKLAEVEQDSFAEAYLSVSYEAFGPCEALIPSFAGRSIRQAEGTISMAMDSARTELVVLETGAEEGTSWAVTPSITGQVDSIRTESILSLTDDVKYISFRNTADGTPLSSSIRVGKNYGLLTGTFFWKLDTTNAALDLISLSSPQVGPQLPNLSNVYDISVGTELNIIRWRGGLPNTTFIRDQKLEITGYNYSPGDDSVRLFYNLDEYGYSFVPQISEPVDLFSREMVRDSLVRGVADLAFLDAQPGEVVYPTIDWRGNTGIENKAGILRAKLFGCYGLGVGLPWLGNYDQASNCVYGDQESGGYGYYFKGLGGPYYTGGYSSYFNNDLVGAFNDEYDCGESLEIPIIPGNVELAERFDWQLFRPGVQYSYGSIEDPDDGGLLPDYAGIRLTGNGAESLTPTARHGNDASGLDARIGPSYFGNSVYQSPDSTSLAYSSFTVHLRPAALIGESWSINEMYEATIDSIREESFFELTDSVKYISFREPGRDASDLPVMRVSKNYGLLNAVDFELRDNPNLALAGMSSPEFGLQVPSFASITDFQIGDRLDKRFNIRDVDENGVQINNITEQQLTVERVDRITDSLVQVQFLLHELTYTTGQFGISDSVFDGFQTEIITYDLREQPYLDAQYNQVFDAEFGSLNVAVPTGNNCGSDRELGIAFQKFGRVEDDLISNFIFDFGGIFHNRVVGPYEQFIEGAEVINRLLYQSNATATCGTPLDFDDLISGTNAPIFDERIRLYPNPASEQITLEIPTDLGRTSLQLYTVDGRMVRQTAAVNGTRTISIADLAPGLYTVVVVNESGWVSRQRVVVK